MGLIKKRVTTKQRAANRANSGKSRGPKTQLGKAKSSMNAAKHMILARVSPAHMKELRENPAEFEKLRQSLVRAFRPEDEFQSVLVDDMAGIRWRLARLRRAEAGILAAQRQEFRLDHELREARQRAGAGADAVLKTLVQRLYGLGGSADSSIDCEEVVGVLRLIRITVELGRFREDRNLVNLVYGKEKGLEACVVVDLFEKCCAHPASGRSEKQDAERRRLLEKLDAHIEHFQKLGQLFAARDSEVTPCREEAQLMPKQEDLDKVVRYETHLERQFERKLQQLVAWKRAKQGRIFGSDVEELENQELGNSNRNLVALPQR